MSSGEKKNHTVWIVFPVIKLESWFSLLPETKCFLIARGLRYGAKGPSAESDSVAAMSLENADPRPTGGGLTAERFARIG